MDPDDTPRSIGLLSPGFPQLVATEIVEDDAPKTLMLQFKLLNGEVEWVEVDAMERMDNVKMRLQVGRLGAHARKHTPTNTREHAHSRMHTHMHSHTHALTLSHMQSHTHKCTHKCTCTHAHSHMHFHTLLIV